MGHYDVHSNMFVVLVSPPGKSRKSTALRIGKSLLKSLADYGQEVHFSTQASSVAALVQQLASMKNSPHQSLSAYSSELGTLLGSKSVEMVDFLVDIYDCDPDWDKQTVGRGLDKIKLPWFNLMAATTPQWMGDNLSKTAVEGGFVSRTVFVFDDTRLLVAFPKLTPEQLKLKKYLAHDLARICQLEGRFTLSPEAEAFYAQWYESPARLERVSSDYRISGYFERKHVHVLKVAMALSLAAKDELILQPEEIGAAISLLDSIEPGMAKAFAAVGKNIHGTTMGRIEDQVRLARVIPYKRVLAANIHDVQKEDLDKLLQALHDMGRIVWRNDKIYHPDAV